MEALIMMIIVGLISSFFNKKGEQKKNAKPMPPFNNPSAPPKPKQQTQLPKSLEDFANEIFGQLSEKKAEVKPAPVEISQAVSEPAVEKLQEERFTSSRPPLAERTLVKKLKQEPAFQVVPKNQKQVMQAVVMAEILGKPKAKR